MIRTLVVDDEPLAREGVRVRLESERDVELVGEAGDGPAAVEAIRRLLPDLVVLDVQMPGIDGFEVLARVADTCLPAVIFVTAYDRYALRAFEVHALDYLLKPFTAARLHDAMNRVRRELERDGDRDDLAAVVGMIGARERGRAPDAPPGSQAPRDTHYTERWAVKDGERYLMLRADEVDWIEAAANYVRFHARDTSFLLRSTLAAVAGTLDPRRFARIHRSTIVNIDRVREVRPEWHGDFDVLLAGGQLLRMSRRYREALLR
jgi:two-component system LytT family response regulator